MRRVQQLAGGQQHRVGRQARQGSGERVLRHARLPAQVQQPGIHAGAGAALLVHAGDMRGKRQGAAEFARLQDGTQLAQFGIGLMRHVAGALEPLLGVARVAGGERRFAPAHQFQPRGLGCGAACVLRHPARRFMRHHAAGDQEGGAQRQAGPSIHRDFILRKCKRPIACCDGPEVPGAARNSARSCRGWCYGSRVMRGFCRFAAAGL